MKVLSMTFQVSSGYLRPKHLSASTRPSAVGAATTWGSAWRVSLN